MDLSLLTTLKDKVQTEDNFTKIWEYFLDHFGEKPAFFDEGERISSSFLTTVFAVIGQQLLKKDNLCPRDIVLVRLVDHQFIHGACHFDGMLMNVIYFEDIEMGVAGFFSPFSDDYQMARFTRKMIERSREPSLN